MPRLSRLVVGSACVVVVGCVSASSAPRTTPRSPVTATAASEPAQNAGDDGQATGQAGPDLDKRQIREVVTDRIEDIRDCYNRGLAEEPNLIGRVAIEFVIGPEGAVVQSTIAENDLPESASEVADCIVRATASWTFPRKGAPVPGVAVELRVFEGNLPSTRQASTDDQGQASFVDVPSATKFKAAVVDHHTSESMETRDAGLGVVLLVD